MRSVNPILVSRTSSQVFSLNNVRLRIKDIIGCLLIALLTGSCSKENIAGGQDEAPTSPPFSGTIFIDPDIITSADPTSFLALSDAGQGLRTMFDRRVEGWINVNAFLFDASFEGADDIEIQVNPEFGDVDAARIEAQRYAPVIGQLPGGLRRNVETVWIHKGVNPFGGGNNNLLIHTGQADLYVNNGILEETFVHEASHTSLDARFASAHGWLAAQDADPVFISTYARDNPTREDIAETWLTYFAIRYRADRISTSLKDKIVAAVPNRIKYFDEHPFDLSPQVTMGKN